MLKFITSSTAAATGLALLAAPASAKEATPSVSAPIPVTSESRPFLGAQATMAKHDYVEEEYFLSGTANTYDWTGKGHRVKLIAGPGKYVTRILVRRPRDAAKFGGNVEVTVLNASLGVDFGGPTDFARMVKQGDVWIGITTKALTANALKKFDPVRYAPLDWSNQAPADKRCARPSMIPTYMIGPKDQVAELMKSGPAGSFPESEDGLVWDILGQLGQLLKSDARSAILPGFKKPMVFMTGVSQSSIYIRTFIAGFHDRFHTADGKPVYDGYLGVVGPAMAAINQCAGDVALDDPKQKLVRPSVPFISISSEGEIWQARYTWQKDAMTRKGGIVSYEVAGASHQAREVPGLVPDTLSFAPVPDMIKAGMIIPKGALALGDLPAGTQPNDYIWQPLIRGAYYNLQLWAKSGTLPPRAPRIALDANLEIQRDANGNALGGLRMPYIDAPLAGHWGYMTPYGMGGVRGYKRPFSPDTFSTLYPSNASYVGKFEAATDKLMAGRWILAEDAEAMKAAVKLPTKR
jgi:Alpha/beta hydrolase domain